MIYTPAHGMVLARDAVRRGDDRVKAAFLEGFEMRGDADPVRTGIMNRLAG